MTIEQFKQVLKKIGYLILTLAILFGLIAFAITKVANPNEYKPLIEKKFAERTGYQLMIKGDIKLSLLPLVTRVTIDGADVLDPKHNIKVVKMDKLQVNMLWHDLLLGKINFSEVRMDRPRIRIIKANTSQSDIQRNSENGSGNENNKNKSEETDHTDQDKNDSNKGHATEAKKNYPVIKISRFVINDASFIYENPKKHFGYQVSHVKLDNHNFSFMPKTSQALRGESAKETRLLEQIETNGRLQVGELWLGQMHIRDADMNYNISDGQITLSPVHYAFNGSPGLASFILYHQAEHMHMALKNHLDDANLVYRSIEKTNDNKPLAFATMPLLLDIKSGKLSVHTDIEANFNSFAELGQKLNGDIKLTLRDGTINRFNLDYELQRLEDRINRVDVEPPELNRSTAFDLFSFDIAIKDGKAKDFPVRLKAPSFSFDGKGNIDLNHEPPWLRLDVHIRPEPGKFRKLEQALDQYLKGDIRGSIPLSFTGPLYQPSKLTTKVDQKIVEKILENFFASWPKAMKEKLILKLEGKLKKSLSKMQKRLNQEQGA